MNNKQVIKELQQIKAGIEADRFTMENIDYLIAKLRKADNAA